jgi:cell division protein FtsL
MNTNTLEIDLLIPDESTLDINQNQIEKEQILEELMPVLEKSTDEFGVSILFRVFAGMFIVILLTFPKIHFKNRIYHLSREIHTLEKEYKFLKEENNILKKKLEKQKFKSEVLDTIF